MTRTVLLPVPAMLLLARCEEMIATGAGGDIRTAWGHAACPLGDDARDVLAAQIAVPGDAAECQQLALTIEDSRANAVDRQATLDRRAQIGCPTITVTSN